MFIPFSCSFIIKFFGKKKLIVIEKLVDNNYLQTYFTNVIDVTEC